MNQVRVQRLTEITKKVHKAKSIATCTQDREGDPDGKSPFIMLCEAVEEILVMLTRQEL